MRKTIALLLVAALVLCFSGVAMATQVHSIDTVAPYDDPQNVAKDLGVTVDVAATIMIDTFEKTATPIEDPKLQKDDLYIGPLNPKFKPTGTDALWWLVKSNKPYYKTISWTDLTGTGPENRGVIMPASRLNVTVEGASANNPGEIRPPAGGDFPPTDGHWENLDVSATITWLDVAGPYVGTLTLDAHQM